MAKLSTIVIGFIIVSAVSLVLIQLVSDLAFNYGIDNTRLMNDSGGMCSASNTLREMRELGALFNNGTIDSGTYAPGQVNAQVGSNMVTSTQSSGLVVSLKTAVAPLTLTKSMITDLGCALSIPPTLITSFEIVFAITILLLIAGIFYFRPI
jgi:hypothetical protein